MTRRLKKDGSTYFGPYFPANLAHRLVHFIHRHFLVPSCKVDLTRFHPKPCLQYHIHRCQGPCVEGLTTGDVYARAVHDVKLFLEGRHNDLAREMRRRMQSWRAATTTWRAKCAGACKPPPTKCASKRPPPCATCSPPWKRSKSGRRWPRPKATTWISLRTMPSLLWWPSTCSTCPVPPAQRPDRGPPRVLLGRSGGVRRAAVLLFAPHPALSGPAVHSHRNPRAAGLRGSRSPGRVAQRKAQSARGDPHAAARAEEGAHGPGGDQRAPQLRRPFPRLEALVTRHSGGAAGRAQPAGCALAHRVFRHLPHPGHGQGGQHGGVGRRPHEEIRLP
ncbi:hypothetical protein SBA3_3010001 [Candidatus Sulfopaludibacter sp. SbA3]|nr:hypothetical protein SBA3_3010001 [Candidatus Sulfopaludibacter sp. SbA3]